MSALIWTSQLSRAWRFRQNTEPLRTWVSLHRIRVAVAWLFGGLQVNYGKCWSLVDIQLMLVIKFPYHSICPHNIFMTLCVQTGNFNNILMNEWTMSTFMDHLFWPQCRLFYICYISTFCFTIIPWKQIPLLSSLYRGKLRFFKRLNNYLKDSGLVSGGSGFFHT